MDGDERIFSDDSSKIAMKERVFKARILPLSVIFFAIIIPQFIMSIISHDPVRIVTYSIALAVYIATFITFAVNYYRFKK